MMRGPALSPLLGWAAPSARPPSERPPRLRQSRPGEHPPHLESAGDREKNSSCFESQHSNVWLPRAALLARDAAPFRRLGAPHRASPAVEGHHTASEKNYCTQAELHGSLRNLLPAPPRHTCIAQAVSLPWKTCSCDAMFSSASSSRE